MLNTKRIDILNIGLIVVSLGIAIKLPFKLFLFSYAVLGPLHYLTEISWLRQKNYYIKPHKNWVAILTITAALMSIYPILKFTSWKLDPAFMEILNLTGKGVNIWLLIGFLFSVSLIFLKKTKHLLMMLLGAILISFLANAYASDALIFIGVFLPTLVHVYFFTMLFIFYGAIKSKSKYGFYLGITLLSIPFIIAYIPIDLLQYRPSKETTDTFLTSNIQFVSGFLAKLLGGLHQGQFHALSEIGIRIQIFIAFAYTYHYLNWFSKISIIGWKKSMPQKRFILILATWIISVSIYAYDYKAGFMSLFFLSFLHVFLEFPLNIVTIREILSAGRRA